MKDLLSSSSSVCPFANNSVENDKNPNKSPAKDGDNSNDCCSTMSVSSSGESSTRSTQTIHQSSWKECPFFNKVGGGAQKKCPFSDATSEEEVAEIFKRLGSKLPKSHVDESRPMRTILIETLKKVHRDEVMETFSFGSIISRLVMEDEQMKLLDLDDDAEEKVEIHNFSSLHVTSTTVGGSSDKIPSATVTAQQGRRNVDTIQQSVSSHGIQSLHQQQRRLSEALKTGTEDAHREAENVHFVKNFIRGKIDRNLYGLFVAQLYHVYEHLERALDECAAIHFPDCHFPKELSRFQALKEDVDFWYGGDEGDEKIPPVSPATQDYIDRIESVSKERPILLLAHAYTRYLGDLSGGKILARVAKRALMLDSAGSGKDGKVTEGLAFYDFPLLRGSIKAFKDTYRSKLNKLDVTDGVVQEIVTEANIAFLLNMRLFEELDVIGSVPGAKVRPIEDVYVDAVSFSASRTNLSHKGSGSEEQVEERMVTSNTSQPPCPFLTSSTKTVKNQHSIIDSGIGFVEKRAICPWPFILLHDPKKGMRKWQTWALLGLTFAFLYQKFIATTSS